MIGVTDTVRAGVASLLADNTVTYTYHKTSSWKLPLWVSPLDSAYIRLVRDEYAGYMETMVYSNVEGEAVKWSLLASQEQVVLYLFAADYPIPQGTIHVYGWWDVPEPVVKLIGSEG